MRRAAFLYTLATVAAMLTTSIANHVFSADWVDPEWTHSKATKLAVDVPGPFVRLDDDSLLRVGGGFSYTSKDDGKTWTKLAKLYDGPKPGTPRNGMLLRAKDGTIVMIYSDRDTYKIKLNHNGQPYSDDSRQDIWAIRSLDGGKTWVDRQCIYHGYGLVLTNIMQSDNGNIVVPLQGLLITRTRHSMCSAVSSDGGKTWRLSNVIDLGGFGNHDGAFEATIAQLSDGRLWMLIRTNLDEFWSAYSSDNGDSWRVIQPSGIAASSSPGCLLRLESGRLMLVWNRLYPEGKTSYPRKEDKTLRASRLANWHRGELSMMLSEDDGKTWTKPVVIARTESKVGISYPDLFERHPGEIWVTTRHPDKPRVRIALQESDFVEKD